MLLFVMAGGVCSRVCVMRNSHAEHGENRFLQFCGAFYGSTRVKRESPAEGLELLLMQPSRAAPVSCFSALLRGWTPEGWHKGGRGWNAGGHMINSPPPFSYSHPYNKCERGGMLIVTIIKNKGNIYKALLSKRKLFTLSFAFRGPP